MACGRACGMACGMKCGMACCVIGDEVEAVVLVIFVVILCFRQSSSLIFDEVTFDSATPPMQAHFTSITPSMQAHFAFNL